MKLLKIPTNIPSHLADHMGRYKGFMVMHIRSPWPPFMIFRYSFE